VNFVTKTAGGVIDLSKGKELIGAPIPTEYDAVTEMAFPDHKAWDRSLEIMRRANVARQIHEDESHYFDRQSVILLFVDEHMYVERQPALVLPEALVEIEAVARRPS
jgi:hypothetical protein